MAFEHLYTKIAEVAATASPKRRGNVLRLTGRSEFLTRQLVRTTQFCHQLEDEIRAQDSTAPADGVELSDADIRSYWAAVADYAADQAKKAKAAKNGGGA